MSIKTITKTKTKSLAKNLKVSRSNFDTRIIFNTNSKIKLKAQKNLAIAGLTLSDYLNKSLSDLAENEVSFNYFIKRELKEETKRNIDEGIKEYWEGKLKKYHNTKDFMKDIM